MRSAIWFHTACYLIFFILIKPSDEVPLDGKNVRDARANELPFVVSIEVKGNKDSNFCVGTLISHRGVLTAAHCVFELKYQQIDVMVGSPDLREGKRYEIESWISYDQWMKTTSDLELSTNDIAIITLKKKVNNCKPAAVLTFSRQDLDWSKVRIAGWGLREEDGVRPMVLKTAVLQVIPNDYCEAHIEAVLQEPFYVPDNLFCSMADPWVLGGCGDSGAPILNKQNQVVGIHRGVCPGRARAYNYPMELVNQHLVNVHLHLHRYRNFISDVKQ